MACRSPLPRVGLRIMHARHNFSGAMPIILMHPRTEPEMSTLAKILATQAAEKASGKLTGSERMKIQILQDIVASTRTTPRAKADAQGGIQQWEARAKVAGHESIAAWLAVR